MSREDLRLAGCESKMSYATWRHARHDARQMNLHRSIKGELFEPYRCHACGSIHIGSKDAFSRKAFRSTIRRMKERESGQPGLPGAEDLIVY